MPQNSIYYAVGRLSVLQKNALNGAKVERLLQCPTVQEARRTLSELGWNDGGSYEQMASAHVENACRLVRKLTTDETLVDCFLLRYDVNNLKMLLKARTLSQEADNLSLCGVYNAEQLRHAVAEHHYPALPETLRTALDALEKRLALNVDPLDIDVTLDKAMYETIFAWLPKQAHTERGFFASRVDMLNLVISLRVMHMGKGAAFLKNVLLPGGTVSAEAYLKAFDKPERLPLLLQRYGGKVYQAAIAAAMEPGKIAQLERTMDDYLLSVYAAYRRDLDKVQRVIGYLMMCEREAAAVRLIMAGKTAGFATEKIRERLRELYG